MNHRAIFLDRDGVINRAMVREGKPYPPATLAELEILPGVPEALRRLKANGFLLIVVTNQPDVARGLTPRATVEAFHACLREQLPLDDFRTCYHDSGDHCACRKPKPGLLVQAAVDWGIDTKQCFMIGDRWRDMEAGQHAGCWTIFIDCGYAEQQPECCDYRVASLLDAATIILTNFA